MGLTTALFFVVGLTVALAQFPPGGFGETRYVDANTKQVVLSVKGDIVTRLIDMGIRVIDFEPLFYRQRVAAGTGYLVKIRIDYGQYIHVSIFRHLFGSSTEVLNIEVGKSLADPLV
uniref:Cystatin-A-like n=1 Tax=Crassostrea virginica TaxID=6565 RepID=A0A8B8AV98_CRAVI|nr:cystatin-A-like [Crassostrea virginica]